MSYKQNLHTHTDFCDGKDNVKKVIEKAIELSFNSIGFSGHSYMSYSPSHSMSIEGTKQYIDEVHILQAEYRDKIDIFCGIEYDMYSNIDISEFDYSIGSFHYFKFDNGYVGFDRSAEEVQSVINNYFNGDGMSYVKKYYEEISKLPEYGNFDIIGHFDLVAKHIETSNFFDENSKQYLSYAIEAMDALKGKIPFFEVNTGAIARGYRTAPYPSVPLIKEFKRMGFGVVITSDCHDARQLDCAFDTSVELLKHSGFKEKYILTDNGFISVEL